MPNPRTCPRCHGWGTIPDPEWPGKYLPCPDCKPRTKPAS